MRHHGTIKEDRRGLAAIAGLLFGIIAGAAMLGGPTEGPASHSDQRRPAVAELVRR